MNFFEFIIIVIIFIVLIFLFFLTTQPFIIFEQLSDTKFIEPNIELTPKRIIIPLNKYQVEDIYTSINVDLSGGFVTFNTRLFNKTVSINDTNKLIIPMLTYFKAI